MGVPPLILMPPAIGTPIGFSPFSAGPVAASKLGLAEKSFAINQAVWSAGVILAPAPGAGKLIVPINLAIGIEQTAAGAAGVNWNVLYDAAGMAGFTLFTAVATDINNLRDKAYTNIAPTQNLWTQLGTRTPMNAGVRIFFSADPGVLAAGTVFVSMMYSISTMSTGIA